MEEIEDYFRHLAETSDDLQHTEERPAFFLYDYDRFFEATVKAPVVLFMHPFTGGFADSKGDNKLDLQRPQWSIWMQIDETKVNDASRVIRETKRIANKILARIKWHLEEDPSMAYCDLLRYYDLNDVEYKIDEIYHDNWTGFRVIVPLAVPAEMEGGNWDGSPLLLETGAPLDAEFELNGEESKKLSDLDLAEELEDEALFYISQGGEDFGVTWAQQREIEELRLRNTARAYAKGQALSAFAVEAVEGSVTLDLKNGNYFPVGVTQNITFSAVVLLEENGVKKAESFVVHVSIGGGGGFAVNFAESWQWAGNDNVKPELPNVAGDEYLLFGFALPDNRVVISLNKLLPI